MGLLPAADVDHAPRGAERTAAPNDGGRIISTAAPLARSQAAFGIAGSVLGLIGVLLPHPSEFDVPALLALQAATVATAAPLLFLADRVPTWMARSMPAFGTILITLSVIASRDATSAYALFYLWPAVYAFYFLSRYDAVFHIAFAAASYAIAIAVVGGTGEVTGSGALIHHFVITVGTLIVVGTLLLYLRGEAEKLTEQLLDAARTDLLTGLRNHRGLREQLEQEAERAQLGDTRVSLLLAGLDNFEQLNERIGSVRGDEVLRDVGRLLDEGTRRMDTVARTGEAEFAITLPQTDEHNAYLVAEQLLGRVRRNAGSQPISLTLSVGVATFPNHADGVEGLLRVGGQALEAAKLLGRARAVLFSPEVPELLSGMVNAQLSDAQAHLITLLGLAEALDLRDSGTARHSETVGRYAERIARELGLPAKRVERVRLAGMLHDIGKIGVPDSILRKAGPLDDEERAAMRRHPEIGARILGPSSLSDVREWVLCSHERPDGLGYPRGLCGDELPLEARIVAVADAYEAITTTRPYHEAIPHSEGQQELIRCAGTQFDSRVVSAFLRSLERQGSDLPAEARPS